MKKHICEIVFLSLCLGTTALYAQIPQTTLYRFQLTQDDTLRWHIHSPTVLSAWNTGGYTNQPEWVNDHTLLVSALRTGASQNDIYLLDLSKKTFRQMTETAESEFSPQVTPDGNHFTVVRQVLEDSMDQQIYQFPMDLSYAGKPLYPALMNVGYYCWLGDHEMAALLVDDPTKLTLVSLEDQTSNIYSSGIGRCLRRTDNGDLAYVHKYSESFWFLKNMNPQTRRAEILIETLFGKEDFAIAPNGDYFMGSGSTLYVFHPTSENKKWIPVFDLAIYGIKNITRLAINSQNQIAIVESE